MTARPASPKGPIELYLIRHGLAAERGDEFPDDSMRPLTREGVERLRAEAKGLVRLEVELDHMLTSPLVRAVQTAEALARGLAPPPELSTCEALAPGGELSDILAAVRRLQPARRIGLVGHEPDMSRHAAALLRLDGGISFKKGAICRIDLSRPALAAAGTLIWFATPKMLRRLGD